MSKNKYNKQKKIIIIKQKVQIFLENKKTGIYNTYHKLLSGKWIVKRSQFHAS